MCSVFSTRQEDKPDGSVLAKNITLELDRASQSVGNAPPSPSTAFMNAVILECL